MSTSARAPRVARGLARVASARVAGPRGFATGDNDDGPTSRIPHRVAHPREQHPADADDTPGSIFRNSVANKTGLSHALDAVMREGHHDMRAFGRGTLAALASRAAYARFTAAHFHFYSELERRLDDAARGPNPTPTGLVWRAFSEDLRRAPALERDLALLLDTTPSAHPVSPATAAYMSAIASAAEREASSCSAESGGGAMPALLAHFYTRYLADLFGGSMLGWPTRRALGFRTTPQFYVHDVFVEGGAASARKDYVERVYEAINDAGAHVDDAAAAETVDEARRAFAANAAVFAESGGSSLLFATVGGARVLGGYAAERIWGAREQRDLFGRLVKRRDPDTGKF